MQRVAQSRYQLRKEQYPRSTQDATGTMSSFLFPLYVRVDRHGACLSSAIISVMSGTGGPRRSAPPRMTGGAAAKRVEVAVNMMSRRRRVDRRLGYDHRAG